MQINRKTLISELKWVQGFIGKKTTIPILNNVLFEVDGQKLTLTSTDLEYAGVTELACTGGEQWSVAAPVQKLIQYLEKVEEDAITVFTTVADTWLNVTHGGDGTKVAGMSKESYPELPTPPPTMVTLTRLPMAIARTEFAISKEESRFTLNGALLEIVEGKAHLIATDGHRLSRAPLQSAGVEKLRALIPKKALLKAKPFDEPCEFSVDDDHCFFNFGQRRIVCRKLTGNFPDWGRVMPKECANHIIIPTKSTLKTLERVAVYADERSRAVKFSITGGLLTIFASSVETGEAEGKVMGKRGEGATDLEAGYNANYVADFLCATDFQNVAFGWQADTLKADGITVDRRGGTMAAVLTTHDGWQMAIMPMRI